MRVVTDVAGIDKEFDYLVPVGSEEIPGVGTELRVNLAGRPVGAWITAVAVQPTEGMALRAYAKVRGWGPEPALVDLAAWAAWRWAGRRSSFLRTASAGFAVPRLPDPERRPPTRPSGGTFLEGLGPDMTADRPHILRLAPATDPTALVAAMAQRGPTLVIVPTANRASVLAERIRRAGGRVALMPGDWAQARAGRGAVIGTRSAAWAPCPGLAAVVVLDGHDEGLVSEGAPTWSAVTVAVERARRAGIPCVIVSACPTPELVQMGPVVAASDRTTERGGWAAIDVVDRRGDDPRLGLYSDHLVQAVRHEKRVLCVLNRKGRIRLLACASCGELARCEICGRAVVQTGPASPLECPACGHLRPSVCPACGSTRMRRLRIGVTKAREELETLSGRPVAELTAASTSVPAEELIVGTAAALHRLAPGDGLSVVCFLDFDQELLAPRISAGPEALALLALASRLVRGRAGRTILQTRAPDHPVIAAAVAGDPSILSDAELAIRRELVLPPFATVALVSGEDSSRYVAGLRALPGAPIQAIGPDGDRWLLKAGSPSVLADSLSAVPRPSGGLRVAVEPAGL